MGIISCKWKELSEEDKRPYYLKAAEDKERNLKEKLEAHQNNMNNNVGK